LHPTTDALQMYEEVERSFRALDRISEMVEAIRGRRSGRIRVIALHACADGLVSRALGRFIRKHPGVVVKLESAATATVLDNVISEQYDVGIITVPLRATGLDVAELGTYDSVCICPAGHHFSSFETVHAADLKDESFVSLAEGSPFRFAVQRLFRRARISPPVVAEVQTQRAICSMVANRAGVSIVDPDVAREFAPGELSVLRLSPVMQWTVAAITAKRRAPSQAAMAFVGQLQQELSPS